MRYTRNGAISSRSHLHVHPFNIACDDAMFSHKLNKGKPCALIRASGARALEARSRDAIAFTQAAQKFRPGIVCDAQAALEKTAGTVEDIQRRVKTCFCH
jgi:hypothetical protein